MVGLQPSGGFLCQSVKELYFYMQRYEEYTNYATKIDV